MLYDVYEVTDRTNPDVMIERVYQASEPVYDAMQLLKSIKARVSQQQKMDVKNVKVVIIGQVENIGGEPPKV